MRRLGGIPSRQSYLESGGEGKETVDKAVHPALRQTCGNGQREERRDGLSTHSRNIAQPARQTAVSH